MSGAPPGYDATASLIPDYKGDTGMMAMRGGGGGAGETSWQQSLIPAYGGDVKFEAVQGGGGQTNEEQAIAVAMAANNTEIGITPKAAEIPLNLPRNISNEVPRGIRWANQVGKPLEVIKEIRSTDPVRPGEPAKPNVNIIMLNNGEDAATAIAAATNMNVKNAEEAGKEAGKNNDKEPKKPADISGADQEVFYSDAPLKSVDFFEATYKIHPNGKIGEDVKDNDNYKVLSLLGLIGDVVSETEKRKILLAIWNGCSTSMSTMSQDERCEPMREFLVNLSLGMMDEIVPEKRIDWGKFLPRPRIAAAPASEPKEPAAEPKEPAAEPKEPAAEPKEPAAEPKEPAAEPKEPASEPEESVVEPKEPAAEQEIEPETKYNRNINDLAVLVATTAALDRISTSNSDIINNHKIPDTTPIKDLAATIATNVALDRVYNLEKPDEVPEAAPGEVPEAAPGEVPEAIPGEVPDAIPGEVPAIVPGEVPEAAPGEVNTELQNYEKLEQLEKETRIIQKIQNILQTLTLRSPKIGEKLKELLQLYGELCELDRSLEECHPADNIFRLYKELITTNKENKKTPSEKLKQQKKQQLQRIILTWRRIFPVIVFNSSGGTRKLTKKQLRITRKKVASNNRR